MVTSSTLTFKQTRVKRVAWSQGKGGSYELELVWVLLDFSRGECVPEKGDLGEALIEDFKTHFSHLPGKLHSCLMNSVETVAVGSSIMKFPDNEREHIVPVLVTTNNSIY